MSPPRAVEISEAPTRSLLRRASRRAIGSAAAASVAENAVWLLICRLGSDALNLLLFVLISRVFGPAGLGRYSYGFAVTTFVYVVACLGIEEYGLREYSRMAALERQRFVEELLGTQLVMVCVSLLGLIGYLMLTHPTKPVLIVILSLAVYQIATAVCQTLFVPAMGQQKMVGPALTDLVCRAIAVIVATFAIRIQRADLPAALAGYPVAGVIMLILASVSAVRHGGRLRLVLSSASLTRIARILISFAGIEVFVQLLSRVGLIALTLMRGASAAGLYATGLKLIELVLLPLNFVGVAAYPRLSHAFRHEPGTFRRDSQSLLTLMLIMCAVVACGMTFVAPWLVPTVLGSRYAAAQPILRVIALLGVMQCCELVLGRLLLAADRQVQRALFMAFGALAAVILNVLLVGPFGVYGAIYAASIVYALINLLCVLLLWRVRAGTLQIGSAGTMRR